MRKCKCGNEITGSYQDTCEDCWAMAQPFWDESVDVPEFDGRSEKLELVAA